MPNKDQNNKAKARARELIEWCKELRHYKHEVAMQKLNEEFRLKQDEKEWKFEPDPILKSYIKNLDTRPIMLDIKKLLKKGIVYELSTANQEVVDKIIDKIIESEALVKKDNKIAIEPMRYEGNYYGLAFTINELFDEESSYHDVAIELCEDCIMIFYRKKGDKYYKAIHSENGDNMIDKKCAQRLYDYLEQNKILPIQN